ncbi:Nitrilase family, member 2 [Seminavis robusta]|uniref:Nitrilase family, member 2 n=1 Tax=Seminavis robusta TaxID=568900 RepID=A0A9N8F4S4_9STRA|nr:Nitrilase family, member 2 [Seminavis robusta]|eukprot:Sro3061_g343000.1 Nitrilase family, member 2 (321) ;mRNA; f:6779-8047
MSKNSKGSKGKERQLAANYQLGRFDVLCCRGKIALEHEGNCRFRAMVQSFLHQYAHSSCKVVKSRIVSTIVDSVRQASPEGGFVKFVDEGWIVVSDRFAREKVGQTFRDLLHAQYKSSTKAKARVRNTELSPAPAPYAAPALPSGLPLHVKPSYVSSNTSAAQLPAWVGSCPLQAQMNPTSLIPLSSATPTGIAQFPRESLANTTLNRSTPHDGSIRTSMIASGDHPTQHNFLEQLIQNLDRSSTPGAHEEFENHMLKPLLPAPSVAAPEEAKPARHQMSQMSAESSHMLSDLEPLPLLNDLGSSSAVFSIDSFRWEPRP